MTSSFGPSQLVWNKVPYLKTLMWVWWVVLPLYVKTSIWSYSHIFFITYLFYFCRFLLLLLFAALTSNNAWVPGIVKPHTLKLWDCWFESRAERESCLHLYANSTFHSHLFLSTCQFFMYILFLPCSLLFCAPVWHCAVLWHLQGLGYISLLAALVFIL